MRRPPKVYPPKLPRGRPPKKPKPEVGLTTEQVDNIVAYMRLLALDCDASVEINSRGDCILRVGKMKSVLDAELFAKTCSFDMRDCALFMRGELKRPKKRSRKQLATA